METMFLEYTTVDVVVPLVESVLAPMASVSPFKSRNAFVLRSTSANIGEIKQILELVDIPGQQVCIETKFMELTDEASKQLGIRWDSLESFNVRAGLGPFEYSRTTESVESREDTYDESESKTSSDTLTEYYDIDGEQYETVEEVEVVEISDDESLLVQTVTPTTEIEDSIESSEDISSSVVDSFTETIVDSQSAILEMDSFNMVLSALKKTDGVSIISNPKLIVANGQVGAFFSVGNREPIIRKETTRGTTESPGDKVTAELDTSINTDFIKEGYLETGIILDVRPTVKAEGLIEAEIEPSLRRKVGEKQVEDNSWPIISVKEIKTRFTLRDRQTVAIGGLTDTSDQKKTSKVPLLGDVPLIGKYLFSHTQDVKSQTETVIFVTLSLAEPRELNEDQGIPDQAELVHRKMIENRARRRRFERDLSKVKDALEVESTCDTVPVPPLPETGPSATSPTSAVPASATNAIPPTMTNVTTAASGTVSEATSPMPLKPESERVPMAATNTVVTALPPATNAPGQTTPDMENSGMAPPTNTAGGERVE